MLPFKSFNSKSNRLQNSSIQCHAISKRKEKSELNVFYVAKKLKTWFFPTKDFLKFYTKKQFQFKSWRVLNNFIRSVTRFNVFSSKCVFQLFFQVSAYRQTLILYGGNGTYWFINPWKADFWKRGRRTVLIFTKMSLPKTIKYARI